MALKTKKTEEERERERQEREAQRRNSAYQSNEKRIRNSAVLGGYQATGTSRGTSSSASQKTSSATLQRPSERQQIPSLQKTASRSEQRRNYQEENARNAQRNIQNDNRRFSTGKELKTAKENLEKTRRMSEDTLSSSNGTFKESNADWIDTSRKNSIADTAMEGFSRGVVSLPLALAKLADRITGNKTAIENEKRREDRSRQAMEDHPLAYTGGNLAGNLLTQNMVRGIVNDAVGSTAWTDTARQAASNALSNGATGRQALATGLRAAAPDFAKNLAQQTAVDTVAETLPSIMSDIADQKSGREVLGNAGKNIAQNAAFNALMEIPGLAGVARGTGAEVRNLANALQNPSMVSDAPRPDLPALTPFGESAEQATIPIESAVPVDDIAKLADENVARQAVEEQISNAARNTTMAESIDDGSMRLTESINPKTAQDAKPVSNNEVSQIPEVEQAARQAQDQIPGMDNVNRGVDNVNGSVDGGTGKTDIPGMEDNAGRTKTSQAYTNTGKYGGGWNEAEYKAYTDAQNYQYETVSEKESVERAWQTIREEGADNAKERLLNTDNLSGSDLDALMSIWRMQVENARAVEASGGDAAEMWKESNRIFKKIQTESTHNAQALQALAKWSRNTPEGMLSRADAIINGRTGGTDAASASMEKVYNKYFKDKGKIELSEDFQKNFLDLAERYQDATGREREELMAEMGKLINKQIPVKLPEKIKTYLMDSMLGNFRTLITRNAGGNIGFNAVEQTAERPLAALVDSIIGTKTGRRTQAGLSREALSDYMSGFGKGLSDEWKDFQKTLSGGAGSSLHTARSGESTLEEAIANNRQVFSSFIGDKADQLVKHGLSVGDRPFYEAVYKETLGDYNRMYKAGQMGADVQSLDPETFKEYAEAAAKMNALSACYQDDSALAKGFMDLRNGVAGLSKGVTGVDILSQFAMPFVKTPANIISRAVEYSPLGFIKNAVNTGRDMAANAAREGGVGGLAGLNAAQQNRLANETARNILGTGLFAGGYAAAKSGLISGGYSDDKDEAAIQRANGMQEYALHTGDDYRSIDWVPVLGNNLVAASAFQEAVENNNGNAVDNFGAGLTAGLESQFDTSMLQGLQSLFGSDAYDRNAGIIANVENTVKSGATQAIPSIIRQAAAFDDPYKRQLSGANPDDYYLNNFAYSIPGIRRGLEPKINNQGEALEQNAGRNTLQKFYDNFISPYSTTTETHTPLDDEAMRLSQSIGSDIAFVTSPSRKDITTESYTPSDAEYTNYQRDAGRLKKEIGEGLLQSDFYKQLNDTDKAETLSDVYTAAKAIAREPFTGADPDDRYAKVYKADGLEGVLSYINANINSKKVNFDAEGKGKGLTSANARGKFDAISTTGLTAEEQGKIYYNTLSASEQEKLSDFYNSTGDAGMYQLLRGKALANEDGNGAVKIQEVLDYATSFPEVSEAVVNQLASSATGTFKKEDGVWNYYNKKGKLTKQGEKKQYNYTAPKIDYGEAQTEESSGTQNNSGSLTVNAAESSRYSVSSVSSKDSKKDTYKLTDKQLNSASYGRYQELSKALPEYKISNKDYDDMYKAIDADSNESLKKAEITAYLDSRDDLTSEEKSALFSVYGHSNWKNPYAGGSKTAGSGSGKSSGKKGSGKGSSRKSKKIAFQSYERMNIPSLHQLDSGRASLRSLSGGGGGGNVIPGLNLSNINLGGSGSIPSIASLMNRYQNLYS